MIEGKNDGADGTIRRKKRRMIGVVPLIILIPPG
jgi:hypothetical protein